MVRDPLKLFKPLLSSYLGLPGFMPPLGRSTLALFSIAFITAPSLLLLGAMLAGHHSQLAG